MELSLNPAAQFGNGCANNIKYILFTCLINIYSIPLDSIPVHSGDHSSLNSGMAIFRRNRLPLEWQFGWALCQNLFHRNPPDSAGMTGIWQESVGHNKDLRQRTIRMMADIKE
jgi:hypothetical protein